MLLRTPFVTAAAVLLIGIRAGAEEHRLPSIASNDNRVHAGTFEDGTLVVRLRASRGLLRPEGESGPAIAVEAFGEDTGPLRVPAPLLRVPEGTTIAATVRNDLPEPLRLHGFCAHDGGACAPVDIAAGASQSLRFVASRAGTYHYWGTTTGMPLPFRATGDTQLSGAFVVDAPGTA